jgi:hypothetical protein
LILRRFEMREQLEPVMGGGMRTVTVAHPHPDGREYIIHGNRVPFGAQPEFQMAHGYGLTPGIDKDFFDAWMVENRQLPAVKNKLIFAYIAANKTRDNAREMRDLWTGLEPLDAANLSSDLRVRAIGGGPRVEKASSS